MPAGRPIRCPRLACACARQPGGGFTALAGVFHDNPPGGPFNDDGQLRGSTRWGGNFNLRTGALFIAEMQYALNQPGNGDMDYGDAAGGLPGTYKLGFWYDTAPFPDQQFDNTGLSLADPASTRHRADAAEQFSIYGVVGPDDLAADPRAARARSACSPALMGAPGDRNLINFSVNAGVTLKAPLPGPRRRHRSASASASPRSAAAPAAFDRAIHLLLRRRFAGAHAARPSSRSLTSYQVTPWWQLQPDFQYVFNPGGGILNPNDPTQRVGNEAIFGLRNT